MSQGHSHRIVPLKGNLPRNHLIQGDAERINIAALIAVPASGLLRGNVVNRTHGCRIHRLGGDCLGNPKIRHLHLSIPGNDNILRLNIPVHNVMAVSRRNARRHLDGNADGLLVLQAALLFDIALEGDPLDQLHDNVVKRFFLHNVVDADNVRMGQPGRCLGLHPEFINERPVKGEFLFQYLNGNQAVQGMALGLIDHRHAA